MTQAGRFSGKKNIKLVPRYYHCPISMLLHPSLDQSELQGAQHRWTCLLAAFFHQPLNCHCLRAGLAGQAHLRTHNGWQLNMASTHTQSVLTIVHSPHNAKSWSSNFIKGLPASDHLPENDPPAEHITFLAVIAACECIRTHSNT